MKLLIKFIFCLLSFSAFPLWANDNVCLEYYSRIDRLTQKDFDRVDTNLKHIKTLVRSALRSSGDQTPSILILLREMSQPILQNGLATITQNSTHVSDAAVALKEKAADIILKERLDTITRQQQAATLKDRIFSSREKADALSAAKIESELPNLKAQLERKSQILVNLRSVTEKNENALALLKLETEFLERTKAWVLDLENIEHADSIEVHNLILGISNQITSIRISTGSLAEQIRVLKNAESDLENHISIETDILIQYQQKPAVLAITNEHTRIQKELTNYRSENIQDAERAEIRSLFHRLNLSHANVNSIGPTIETLAQLITIPKEKIKQSLTEFELWKLSQSMFDNISNFFKPLADQKLPIARINYSDIKTYLPTVIAHWNENLKEYNDSVPAPQRVPLYEFDKVAKLSHWSHLTRRESIGTLEIPILEILFMSWITLVPKLDGQSLALNSRAADILLFLGNHLPPDRRNLVSFWNFQKNRLFGSETLDPDLSVDSDFLYRSQTVFGRTPNEYRIVDATLGMALDRSTVYLYPQATFMRVDARELNGKVPNHFPMMIINNSQITLGTRGATTYAPTSGTIVYVPAHRLERTSFNGRGL